MAGISRSLLASMNLTEEQQKTIIDANAETLKEIREERDRYKADAEKLPGVQKQLDDLKAEIPAKYVSKEDHEKTVTEYQQYKADVDAEKSRAAREKAAREYYESKGIKGADLSIAMRGSSAEVAALKLKADGTIEDTATLDALVQGDFSRLVGTAETRTVDTGGSMQPSGNVQKNTNDFMNALIRGKGV